MLPLDAATVGGFGRESPTRVKSVLSTDCGGRAPVLWAKAKSAHPSNTIVARAGGEGFQEFFPGLSGRAVMIEDVSRLLGLAIRYTRFSGLTCGGLPVHCRARGSPNPTLTTGICLSDLERTTCDSLAPSPVAQIVKYPSSSVLINTLGVASAVVNRNEGVWKGSPPATETVTLSAFASIGDARRRASTRDGAGRQVGVDLRFPKIVNHDPARYS